MFRQCIRILAPGLFVTILGSGCESLHNAGVPGLERYVKADPVKLKKAQSQRDQFVENRDHKALYWLLSNTVQTGMRLGEVEQALGEPGEFEPDTSRYNSDGVYQTTDTAYRWGPDNQGYSAILFFRDGYVVNFNPKDFATPRYTTRGLD